MTTPSTLTTTETLSLLSLTLLSISLLLSTLTSSGSNGEPLLASLAFSIIAFCSTYAMIRWLGPTFIAAGLKGKDMSKPAQQNKKEIPETMGAICAVVYLLVIIVFIPFPFYKDIVAATSGGGNRDVLEEREIVEMGRLLHRFPHSKLASYLSALLSLQSVVILGIADDLFDIHWRHKFFIPGIASIPLLIIYLVDFGATSIVIPTPLIPYLGTLLNLGPLYYIYMFSISIFCPNSINILAGINGLEVSQSLIIAFLLLLNDSLYLLPVSQPPDPATDSHLFSVCMLLPFIGVSLALLKHNWYPSAVFVGDTYCYFAGILFAIVSILGHFSKTLLLLLIPQTFNFLYSTPQLFRIIPCPRHRLPRFNARTGLMEPSFTVWQQPPRREVEWGLGVSEKLRLCRLVRDGKGKVMESSNFTLLNLWLVWWGPKREDRLALEILGVQVLCGLFGLFVRHKMALWVFREDNLRFDGV